MIKAETYLALEESLSGKLQDAYKKLTSKLFKSVEDALAEGDYEKAGRLAQSFSLDVIAEEVGPYVEYITNLSMLFGASRVTSKPGTSVVGLGYEKNVTYQAVAMFKQIISVNAVEQLKKQALQLIALRKELVESDTVKKADPLRNFASFMDDAGRAYFNLVSSLHTSRLSAYGFTAEAYALGLDEYRINEQLDARTCPVCRQMHGKIFKVADARRLLDVVIRVTDPDDLRQLQPWPKQNKETLEKLNTMTPDEMVAAGWHIPPFHPRCRGLLARVNKVPSLADIDARHTDERKYATKADFLMLGINATDKQVEKWNNIAEVQPDVLISTMLKQTVTDMLKAIFGKETIVKLSMYEQYAKMKISGAYYGLDNFAAELKLYDDALSVSSGTVFPTMAGFMYYMKSAYLTASEAGVGELRVPRNAAVYDLSAKGFVLSGGNWVLNMNDADAVKKFLK